MHLLARLLVTPIRRPVDGHRQMLHLVLWTLLLGLTLSAPMAQAQEVDQNLMARFQLAESYLRAGQFDRAINLLEDLHAASPQTNAFYEKLKQGYEGVKRYDDAIALVDLRMKDAPNPALLLSEKARLLYLKNDEDAAFATWDAAIAAGGESPSIYLLVYRALMQVRLFDRAITVLEGGRETLGQPDQFITDLAYLYNLTGNHTRAMQEYLRLLDQNDRQLAFVRNRLSHFLEQEEALKTSIAVTASAVQRTPLNRAYRELLGGLYLEAGMYREAFDTYRAIDRLESEEGQVLYAFAQQAADAGAYDVALEAYQEVLTRHAEAPSAPEAQRGLAEMNERRAERLGERAYDANGNRISAPHYEQALDAYRTFLQRYPTHPYYPDVLRRIGRLQQDVLFDLGAAEATLTEVISRYPNTPAADEAAYDRARIALLRDRLDEARLAFSRLAERLHTGELAERARYELALLHFYQGDFEAALTLVEAMKENTAADIANDAIELKVMLVESKGPDSLNTPLRLYAETQLLHRQRRIDEARTRLQTLLQDYGMHALSDDARFLDASLMVEAGDLEAGLTAYRELPLAHPQSYLADRALFRAAELQATALGDDEAAIATYTQLLTDYPGSLLVPEARARIRLLRGDGV